MKLALHRMLLAAGAAVAVCAGAGCERESGTAPPPGVVASAEPPEAPATNETTDRRTAWPVQRIAADPDGYARWWEGKMEEFSAEREAQIRRLELDREFVEGQLQALRQNIAQAESLRESLQRAQRLAPFNRDSKTVQVGGKTIELERVGALVERMETYVRRNRPLAELAGRVGNTIESRIQNTRSQLHRLARIKEKVLIDLQIVRDTKTAEGLDFNDAESQLAAMASTFAATQPLDVDNPLAGPTTLPTTQPIAPMTIDEFLQ